MSICNGMKYRAFFLRMADNYEYKCIYCLCQLSQRGQLMFLVYNCTWPPTAQNSQKCSNPNCLMMIALRVSIETYLAIHNPNISNMRLILSVL